jgi:hypothetical protein
MIKQSSNLLNNHATDFLERLIRKYIYWQEHAYWRRQLFGSKNNHTSETKSGKNVAKNLCRRNKPYPYTLHSTPLLFNWRPELTLPLEY